MKETETYLEMPPLEKGRMEQGRVHTTSAVACGWAWAVEERTDLANGQGR